MSQHKKFLWNFNKNLQGRGWPLQGFLLYVVDCAVYGNCLNVLYINNRGL